MSDVTEKLRFNVIAGIAPITSKEAIDEIDRLRAALAERDQMLGEAVRLLRVSLVESTLDRAIGMANTESFLSAYDASKKEKV